MTTNLLTANDIAERLRISRAQAYNLIIGGDIPKIQIRKSIRVKSEDLDQYIERNRTSNNEFQLNTKSVVSAADLDPYRVNPNLPKESSHE
jgi:excisionase family DNA binding protein